MKHLKALFLGAAIVAGSAFHANAQYFDHLGANLQLGTNGISVEAVSNITDYVNVRLGADFMPGIKFNTDVQYSINVKGPDNLPDPQNRSTTLTGNLGRVQGHFLFNVYPYPKVPFYVAVGGYFAGDKLIKVTGKIDDFDHLKESGNVVIGNYEIPADENGNIKGGLKVNGFRPYVGIGWGRAIPKKLLNFGVDLGVQFEGKPKLYTDYGSLSKTEMEDNNTLNKIINNLGVYPVLALKLEFKAF